MRVGDFELIEPVPEFRNPIAFAMLRPWIDVGRVGSLTLTKLERHLEAKELGRLAEPGNFFDFTRYRPRMRMVNGKRVFTTPNSIVHHAHDDSTDTDYLFLHIREPHSMGERYCDSISQLLTKFEVAEYCRIGGMYDSVPHTRPLLVTGSLTDEQADKTEGLVSRRRSTYQGPTSIVNLVSETMMEAEVSTTSLMAHLPQYVQLDEDHMGAARIMEILCAMYGLPRSLSDPTRGQQQYRDISKAVENNSEVSGLISQLEAYYDRVLAESGESEDSEESETPEESTSQFAPDVERFLSEMGQRLDGDEDEDGEDPADDEEG